jgi:hypothetical protein
VYVGTAPKWRNAIGAVARPQAVDTATTSASGRGIGYPSSNRSRRGAPTKIATTAAKDSWNPGSRREYGFHASSTTAPASRKYHRSRGRAVSQANDTSEPATLARTTDGCQPTASTYAAIARSTATSAASRGTPTIHAMPSSPPAMNATFWPLTARRW